MLFDVIPKDALIYDYSFPLGFYSAGKGAETHESIEVHGHARQAFIIKQGDNGTTVAEICR
tara:strand:- start:20943 stop:21125 length:183 start_codon:yes stop_codon:yes gene_type:complete